MFSKTHVRSCHHVFKRWQSGFSSRPMSQVPSQVRTSEHNEQPEAGELLSRPNVTLRERIPFKRAHRGDFFQSRPKLGNVFSQDVSLQAFLQRMMPEDVYKDIVPDLERFGARIGTEIDQLGLECDRFPPKHQPFDAWGNRVDELVTCEAWKRQKVITAEEGLVSIPYEKKYGPWSRVYQLAKNIMFFPASGLYSCPITMTDGAAQFFLKFPGVTFDPVLADAASRVLSRDPKKFWTSGQWMTERRGGSDVADGCETVAVAQGDGTFKLYGYKWFSSATDADMTLTLARIIDEEGSYVQGTRGVSLFFLRIRDEDGKLNGIEIMKLKDKLGTRQVPTAELLLDGTLAHLISDPGRGVASISHMLNVTRINNSVMAASNMRRILQMARDYSLKRTAFGKRIVDHPLHTQTLARMEVETRAANLLLLDVGRLLGLEENGQHSEDDRLLLRILTPVLKLYTAKQAISVVSEGLESFGGQGYIEDTGLPLMLRDSQVLSIWEGTTNILSLDVLRSILKTEGGTLSVFFVAVRNKLAVLSQHKNEEITNLAAKLEKSSQELQSFITTSSHQGPGFLEVASRDFAYSLGRVYMGTLLLEHAAWQHATKEDFAVASRWCQQDLCPVITNNNNGHYMQSNIDLERVLVMEGHHL